MSTAEVGNYLRNVEYLPESALAEFDVIEDALDLPETTKEMAAKVQRPITEPRLHVGANKRPISNLRNAVALLSGVRWEGKLRFDEMDMAVVITHPDELTTSKIHSSQQFVKLEDQHVTEIKLWLQNNGLDTIGSDNVKEAITHTARKMTFHPIREYLESLVWDGSQRLECWLAKAAGAEDGPYTRQIGKMFLISMVSRIFAPGDKVDHMLVLEGNQGAQKSTLCRVLASDEYFSDSLPDNITNKDASIHIRGKWLIEVAEMGSLSKADVKAAKQFISKQVEKYRPPYGTVEVQEKRQCVFIGTQNEAAYLKDETGARRYWPVKTGNIDIKWLKENRDQIFAEAVMLYKSGKSWWPTREFEKEHIVPEQEQRYEVDPWEHVIYEYLINGKEVVVYDADGKAVQKGNGDYETKQESILTTDATTLLSEVLNIDASRQKAADYRRVGAILTRIGWVKKGKDRWTRRNFWAPGTGWVAKPQSARGGSEACEASEAENLGRRREE